ncbi:MAG: nuclear transport factor 2 family protein [Rhodospirillales bacterium]
MTEQAAVLFANDTFYVAFATCDYPAMEEAWSRRWSVSCIHPGWNALAGREPVMESWRAILSSPKAPRIGCRGAVAHVLGDSAYVICYEVVDGNFLVATNVFVREDGGWKMVHHQAGATSPPPPEDADEEPRSLQ